MAYVIYDKETTQLFQVPTQHVRCYRDSWDSIGAAKAALTRQAQKTAKRTNRPVAEIRAELDARYAILDQSEFSSVEKTKTVYSIMDTKQEHPIQIATNTPACCDPSTETYWSM